MDKIKNWLLPSFFLKGTDMNEIEEIIDFLDNHTMTESCGVGDICQMAIDRSSRDYSAENLTFKAWVPGEDAPRHAALRFNPDNIPRDYFDEVRNLQMMYRVDGTVVMASEAFTSSLFRLLNIPYSGTLKKPSPKRAEYVHEVMTEKADVMATIISRYDGEYGITKAFFCGSGQFRAIPQHAALDILQMFPAKLGAVNLVSWEVDHSFTRLWITFPEYAEDMFEAYADSLPETEKPLIPGLMIETGDIGDCSFKVTETWSSGKTVLYGAEVVKDHRTEKNADGTEMTTDQIVEKIADEVAIHIFDQFVTLPTVFSELLMTEVTSAARVNFEKMFRDFGLTKILGKAVLMEGEPAPIKTSELIEELIESMRGLKPLTAYKVLIEVLRIPEKLKDRQKREDCRKALGKLPYKLASYLPK